jgi:lipopolysaccharide transport system ATP-binding protein
VNAVEFEHVSKSYPIYEKPSDRFRELLALGRRSFHRDFRALRDVSFRIRRGEVFCIIGENGAGKSTCLQLLAGIMQPTLGEVRVTGRISALLELGAGFNPEFPGRDNVYLSASILGFSRAEIDRRYPEIAAFAEIGDFIDQPVKTYSSGMLVRLAFAVAIHVDPEILLVDEALAVGDTYFRHRCMRKVNELRSRGATIVFVSHSMSEVKAIGDRALWLEHGRSMLSGSVEDVVPRYLSAMTDREGRYTVAAPHAIRGEQSVQPVTRIPNIDSRVGDGRAEILGIALLNEYAEPLHLMLPETTITVRITVRARTALAAPVTGFVMRNHLGLDFAGTDTERESRGLAPMRKGEILTIDFRMGVPELYPGTFSFSPFIAEGGSACDSIDNALTVPMARGDGPVYGYIQVPCKVDSVKTAAAAEPEIA